MSSKTQDSKGILWTISLVSFVFLLAISFLFVQRGETESRNKLFSNVLIVKEGQSADDIVNVIRAANKDQLSEIETVLSKQGASTLNETLSISKEKLNSFELPTTITFLSKAKAIDLGAYKDNSLDQLQIRRSGATVPIVSQASFGPWRLLAFIIFGLLSIVALHASLTRYLKDVSGIVSSLKLYGSEETFIKKYLSAHLWSKLILGLLIGVILYCAFVYLSNTYLGLSFLPVRIEYFIFILILLIIVVYLTYKHTINKVIALS